MLVDEHSSNGIWAVSFSGSIKRMYLLQLTVGFVLEQAGMVYGTRRILVQKAIGMGYGRYLAPAIDSRDKIAGIVGIK